VSEDRATAAIATAGCGLVLAALPIFLVGGLAVQIRGELGFSEAALGAAVSGAFLTGAVASPFAGRLADRIGPRATVAVGSALSLLALTGLATARGWTLVVAMLALSGLAIAMTDPGLAILLARSVPVARQGLAFGLKEASIPAATLVAGLAVPLVALTLGWRWAFAVGLVPLAGLALLLPRAAPGHGARAARAAEHEHRKAPGTRTRRASRSGLLLLAVATALGIGAASGIGVFLTQSAVAMGLEPAAAGLLLATGSVAGIVARVAAGAFADRAGDERFGTISKMLAVGALAAALGAAGGPLLVVGTIGVFAAGWAWSGLLFLSLVRSDPEAPGAAAGIGVAGLTAGNGFGPLLFGVAAQRLGFQAAWLGAAAVAAAAAVLMHVARTRFLAPRS
jgi:predicted MFS family arabinose efflux permease